MHDELQQLLRKRLDVIADHAFRDRDPTAHLDALKQVSEKIETYSRAHYETFDGKLRHYLANFSYQKALDHLSA